MKFLFFLLLSGFGVIALGQPVNTNKAHDGKFAPYMGQDFVLYVGSEDTIFCDKVDLVLRKDWVDEVTYTVDGEKRTLKGGHTHKLQAFYANGKVLMELMPTIPDKPGGNKRHLFKNLIGYFTIWTNNHSELYLFQGRWGIGAMRTSFHLVSIKGGPVFNPATKGGKKKRIKPLLESCEGIQETTRTYLEVNKMELTDQCFDYNRLCAPNYK